MYVLHALEQDMAVGSALNVPEMQDARLVMVVEYLLCRRFAGRRGVNVLLAEDLVDAAIVPVEVA